MSLLGGPVGRERKRAALPLGHSLLLLLFDTVRTDENTSSKIRSWHLRNSEVQYLHAERSTYMIWLKVIFMPSYAMVEDSLFSKDMPQIGSAQSSRNFECLVLGCIKQSTFARSLPVREEIIMYRYIVTFTKFILS